MSEEGKFWIVIAFLVVLAFTVLVSGCVINAMHEDNAISAAIRQGVNPMDAYCGYNSGGERPNPICVARAQLNKELLNDK